MDAFDIAAAVLAAALLVYLVIALFAPERFE
jgi:K+-transporting ATPase KdpF subunit